MEKKGKSRSLCVADGCQKKAYYGLPMESTASFCSLHRSQVMIDKKHKLCQAEGCSRHPYYGEIGQKPRFCSLHKTATMKNVRNRQCEVAGCSKQPSYGYKNDERLLARVCAEHKTDDMVVTAKRPRRETQGVKPSHRTFAANAPFGMVPMVPGGEWSRSTMAKEEWPAGDALLQGIYPSTVSYLPALVPMSNNAMLPYGQPFVPMGDNVSRMDPAILARYNFFTGVDNRVLTSAGSGGIGLSLDPSTLGYSTGSPRSVGPSPVSPVEESSGNILMQNMYLPPLQDRYPAAIQTGAGQSTLKLDPSAVPREELQLQDRSPSTVEKDISGAVPRSKEELTHFNPHIAAPSSGSSMYMHNIPTYTFVPCPTQPHTAPHSIRSAPLQQGYIDESVGWIPYANSNVGLGAGAYGSSYYNFLGGPGGNVIMNSPYAVLSPSSAVREPEFGQNTDEHEHSSHKQEPVGGKEDALLDSESKESKESNVTEAAHVTRGSKQEPAGLQLEKDDAQLDSEAVPEEGKERNVKETTHTMSSEGEQPKSSGIS